MPTTNIDLGLLDQKPAQGGSVTFPDLSDFYKKFGAENNYQLPGLGDIYKKFGGDANYENISGLVSSAGGLPQLSSLVLPKIMELLSPGGQGSKPFEESIARMTQANVAGTQSDMMKRGLTGSDIEASAMGAARGQGQMATAQMYGQNAAKLSDMLKEIVGGDIGAQRENLMALAQLMGQKLTSDRDIKMFQQQLDASLSMASDNRQQQMWSSLIGAGGSVGMGYAMHTSDRRLKRAIKKLQTVDGVDIVSFHWTDEAQRMGAGDRPMIGVIAQDLEKEMPELVSERFGVKTVNYGALPIRARIAILAHGGFYA